MCDYSLHGIRNRLAEEGEILIIHRFYTGSKGLTSPEYVKPTAAPKGLLATLKKFFTAAEPQVCAVCIPDGAKLLVHGIPLRLQEIHGLSTDEVVTFRQLFAEAHTYRDAVEFKNGAKVRLQELEEGQQIEVLALSSEKTGLGDVRSNRVWHTESLDTPNGTLAISEEMADFLPRRSAAASQLDP